MDLSVVGLQPVEDAVRAGLRFPPHHHLVKPRQAQHHQGMQYPLEIGFFFGSFSS